ncbi:LacI family DNA-binding transcriptional regulator [Microbacterium testaceum]|jgi:DNA-binding LacI/PurR family transcriptional regulator|uniref:LacI family transcriptional regulator n=1 Tax=Microbacterium testaceum TaxID=2033 RepID=A0A147FCF3_MICTE|nr:LacI family DNA-binding transcriptional regulator [Microbacterium testaceum]KTS03707.1 LacI family transcriptional regulator [Microbacterium testaceum]KTS14271.1 LacI family transcriptional regulator [Microbacterium testaceum]KTS66844.1 LacI family transcriptional regulator [Microbacterium testaceum]KTS90729.1 LacI family transcriptional regulator [Microbacterium testaceum]
MSETDLPDATGRAPSIRDVARLAGVSYQTVSRVINNSPQLRPETAARVRSAIAELKFVPNQAARALATSRSRLIGVLGPRTTTHGTATMVQAIESAARAAGYRLTLTNLATSAPEDVRASIDHLMQQSVEGLIAVAPQTRVVPILDELRLPVPVQIVASTGTSTSHNDQAAGARAAVRHLIEIGHTRILHIAGPRDWVEADHRMRGYLAEMDANDLAPRPPVLGDWTAQFGFEAGLELLRTEDATAVFAGNDHMALGFMHAVRAIGRSVPEDISVVGFDDVPESAHLWPPLTTVRQDFAGIGARAVREVLAALGEPADAGASVEPDHLRLIVRSSTAPPSR